MTVTAHFVTFYSPGMFVHEMTMEPIDSWDTSLALTRARQIIERHGARPYGFQFTTRTRTDADLDSKVTATSPVYYFGVKFESLADVEARDPGSVLAQNMRGNGWPLIVTTTGGYRWSAPLQPTDVVLDDEGQPMPRPAS